VVMISLQRLKAKLLRARLLHYALWGFTLVSIFLAVKLSNAGNSITFDLSSGFIISVIFYWMVVWIPDQQRRGLIKQNLREQYRLFREDSIGIFLDATGTGYEADLPKQLSDQGQFRKYFKEAATDSQTRWDCVLNRLGCDERLLRELLVEMEILMNEVGYVLNNVNIDGSRHVLIL
jgi:hypothetical protein